MKEWKLVVATAAAFALAAAPVARAQGEARAKQASSATVKRGQYLITVMGCNDCHTPLKMGPQGPEPDMSRMLSGHPQDAPLPPAPKPEGPWIASISGTMTAFAGPWGVSYTANLTPDPETGIGKWTARNFIEALRTGRHMGRGRPILPPMPWEWAGKATDADLRAMFAYLMTVKPISNRVPDPVPPAVAAGGPAGAPSTGTGAGSAPAGK